MSKVKSAVKSSQPPTLEGWSSASALNLPYLTTSHCFSHEHVHIHIHCFSHEHVHIHIHCLVMDMYIYMFIVLVMNMYIYMFIV